MRKHVIQQYVPLFTFSNGFVVSKLFHESFNIQVFFTSIGSEILILGTSLVIILLVLDFFGKRNSFEHLIINIL
jgi:hypothetical protein